MRVGIIGAGSIGLLFAAYISRSVEVVIYTRTLEQANEINKAGIHLKKGKEESLSWVKSLPITSFKGTEDLTIIAVKQYQLPAIIEKLNFLPVIPENLLFIQNGMGHLKLLKGIKANNVFIGSVEHGALKENSITVRHNGDGITNVAVFQGDSFWIQQFAVAVSHEFPMIFQEDYYDMLIKKLIVNAVINPLTAILHVKNGVLIENPYYFQEFHNLVAEIASVLHLEPVEKYLQLVIDICKKTATNRSSMLKDIESKGLTEIEAILGYILEEAARQGMKAPKIETLYYLVKGKEKEGEEVL